MASCNVSSHLVVDVLEKDAHLLRDCARLINTLRIPEVKIVQVLSSYKLGVATSYDVFKAIIDNWVEIDGEAATLGKLGEILKEMNFLRLAGNTYFPCMIISNNSIRGIVLIEVLERLV